MIICFQFHTAKSNLQPWVINGSQVCLYHRKEICALGFTNRYIYFGILRQFESHAPFFTQCLFYPPKIGLAASGGGRSVIDVRVPYFIKRPPLSFDRSSARLESKCACPKFQNAVTYCGRDAERR